MGAKMSTRDQFVKFSLIICNQGWVCDFQQIVVVAECIVIRHIPRTHKENSAINNDHLIVHQTARASTVDKLNACTFQHSDRIEVLPGWRLSSSQSLAAIFTIIHNADL